VNWWENAPLADQPDQWWEKYPTAEQPTKPEERSFGQKAKDLIVGRKEFDLPEFDMPFELSKRQAKTALGLMTTFDPKRELSVVKENYPDLTFSEDKYGNIIVDAEAYGGEKGYLNSPGISIRDIAKVGFNVASFTPAAKAGAVAKSFIPRMLAVGGSTAATQAGIDLASQAAGGTEDVSLANINKIDVALAGLGGAVFEGIGQIAAKILPAWRKSRVITEKVRKEFKRAAEAAGKSPDDITDDLIRSYMDMADDAVSPKGMSAVRDTDEFGIPYTKGQATKSLKDIQIEDSLRQGVYGPRAQETMLTFGEKVQRPAIMSAAQKAQAQLSGGKRLIESPAQAGEVVREGIKARAGVLDDAIGQAYEQVGNASLKPEGMRGLVTRLLRTAKREGFETVADLAPATKSTLNELDDFAKFLKEAKRLRPTHIRKLETFRKRLNAKFNAAKNNTDRRQILILKREFDNYLDQAMDRALFYGDDEALNALKGARGLRAEYAKKFQRADIRTKGGRLVKDQAGDVIERMIAADPTDEQVINYMFGSAKIGAKQEGARVAQRIKEVTGAGDEWRAVREAAFMKLAKPNREGVISGREFAGRLEDLINESPTMMRTLFEKDEILMMKRLASAIKRAQPEIGNPSRTTYTAARIAWQVWDRLMISLGFAQAGLPGATAARGAVAVSKGVVGARAAGKAKAAIRGVQRPAPRLNIGNLGALSALGSRQWQEQ